MEAVLYDKLAGEVAGCRLCSHRCKIKPGRHGICGVRENRSGTLHTLVYGKLVARQIDPIEKKPIFHLAPGSRSYSLATVGCNFKCRFCQNADIAQLPADNNGMIAGRTSAPEAVVTEALQNGCRTIAYTYTEPTVYFEFAFDAARLAHGKGLRNVFVTNGYLTEEALLKVAPYLDAANVDLKSFSEEFYQKYCGARLKPVKETLIRMKRLGILVEVTTLLIPGLNDSVGELTDMAAFIVDALGVETPWHISRFHPCYRMTDRPATPVKTIMAARQIGIDAGLRYVYSGNIPGEGGESTVCHGCGSTVIERVGFMIRANRIANSRCPDCQAVIDGVEL